jgi:hypothetical protein
VALHFDKLSTGDKLRDRNRVKLRDRSGPEGDVSRCSR